MENNEYTCQMLNPGDGLPCRSYIRPKDPAEPGFCSQPEIFRCPEAMKKKLPFISYSRLTDFIACRRKYYHGVVEGLQVKAEHLPEPIKLGRAWDAFIHHLHDENFDHLAGIQSRQLSPEQTAKISALMRSYKELEVSVDKEGLVGCQYKIHAPIGTTNIIGFVDRAYENCIVETKLSSRPDFYQQKENVAYQLGTYFLGNEAWKYGIVEIVRAPTLRTGQGRYQDEDPEEFENRIFSDIVSRPGFYFVGWDRKTKTYGVKFWRSEFDLDEIFRTYRDVLQEIQRAAQEGSRWRNKLACHVPTPCPYLPIKRTGVISEEIYERRQKKGGEVV